MFGIFTLVFINFIVREEVENRQVTIWLSTSTSRLNIVFSKFIFLIICIFIIWAPSFISTVSTLAFARDAKQNIGYLFLQYFYFLFAILSIASLFFLISHIFIEKKYVSYVIYTILIILMAIPSVLQPEIYHNDSESIQRAYNDWYIFYFLSLNALYPNVLTFTNPEQLPELPDDVYALFIPGTHKFINLWHVIISPFLNFIIICSSFVLSTSIFKKLNVKI
ncbi:hypothetical protein NPX79_00650 [Spiroplasma endosymbiont of Anurida maritima]|uniref:hypothetical protein n=1 Tax=Spiroplasma endosymbiont of Anurida maritima TaxID=2967972 RepID=UPI0036D38D04